MKKRSFIKSLTVIAPIVGILCGSGGVIYEIRRLRYLEKKFDSTTRELTTIDRELKEFAARPPMQKTPTAPASTREQPQFLDILRGYADANHVQMIRWSNLNLPAPPVNGDGGAKPPVSSVTPVISTVEIAGQYESTRMFMYSLMRSPRLLNMTELKWVRGDKWPTTHLTFTLTRYVGPPEKTTESDQTVQKTAQNPGPNPLLHEAPAQLHPSATGNATPLTPIQAGQLSADATSSAFTNVVKSSTADSGTNAPVGETEKVPPQKESPIIVKRR